MWTRAGPSLSERARRWALAGVSDSAGTHGRRDGCGGGPGQDRLIDPAEVLDLTGSADPAEIAGTEDPVRRIARDAEEVLDGGPLGEVVAVEVAAGEADAGDADLSGLAGRERAVRVVAVQDGGRVTRQRHAEADRLVGLQLSPGGGDDGGSWTVGAEDPPAGPVPPGEELPWDGLAGEQQEPQVRQVARHVVELGGRAAQCGDAVAGQEAVQLLSAQPGRLGHEGCARHPRNPDLFDGTAGAQRRAWVDPVARADPVDLGGDRDDVADARVVDRHARREIARGAAVHDERQRVGPTVELDREQPAVRKLGDQPSSLVDEEHLGVGGPRRPGERRPLPQLGPAEHEPHPGIRHDVGDVVVGGRCVQRYVDAADLQHRQHRDVGVDRAIEQQRDPVACGGAVQAQVAGQPVGPCVQLVVGQRHLVAVDRELAGPAVLPDPVATLLEQVVEALVLTDPPALRFVLVDQDQLGHRPGGPGGGPLGQPDGALLRSGPQVHEGLARVLARGLPRR